jgi:antitoxin (DNA-binding transcriptional repressor) of toxin-antitoxin stability system
MLDETPKCRDKEHMTTLTVTKARQNLGGWLKRAVSGEEIGVLVGNQVVALRPVPIMAADYMETEYGLTKEEADRAANHIIAKAGQGPYIGLDELKRQLAARGKAKRAGRAGRTD